ncbi:hypothetical protein CDAR_293721 [Caerostris darwini]|uniref:Uncharacterized protein n=1 Tax=Caerostris darwini TaxID=1538125 RepID=A0AAV4PK79_9ARAC|nr:hypothetical protein CDAR_293721 [Caerostris darwini]
MLTAMVCKPVKFRFVQIKLNILRNQLLRTAHVLSSRARMPMLRFIEYCDSAQNPQSDDSGAVHSETKQRKMRLGTHRCRHFRRKPRPEGVPEAIGWRRRFVQAVSNIVRRFRKIRRR